MADDAELLERARALLWEVHGRIHDALIVDEISPLWEWREGPLTDFLIESGDLLEAREAAPRVLDVGDAASP